jgi:hypothetical protein
VTEPDEQQPEVPDEPVGWTVHSPEGDVVAMGGQAVVTAVADTGEQET